MPPAFSNQMTMKRIHREIADLKKEDLGALTLAPTEDNLFLWKGTIPGPDGSVYEGGVFNLDVVLAPDYPFTAPKVMFKTRIYHMNISDRGDICIDILKQNWSPALSLFKVMLSLSSLLTDPNPRDPLVSSIANQYVSNRRLHDDTARQWTALYARPKLPPTTQKPSSKALGKAKAVSSSSTATGSHQSPVVNSSSVPIEIDDSDDETTIRSRARAVAGTKRKREARADDSAAADDGDEGDVELTGPSGSRKTASRGSESRAAASGSGRRVAPRLSTEVIVIEDD
ncbi:ubiquitin-conjugating enzyme e2 e2-like [Moniliophthora roreri MCA 2997]|uniref:E2 ubiquitin-conjugating enzyme n=2 Tax=Moniliophthora roreri TaxID=221103 RepID=V2XD42_MONRO|nr:ubiquitin-conjugating enzyme e2 e2-like [Moniliophthora roreri MCA 2997]